MAADSVGLLAPLRALTDSFGISRDGIFSELSEWLIRYGAPQAQSSFLDLHTFEVRLWHWMGFYGVVFLFWMLPTQRSTRREMQCTGS